MMDDLQEIRHLVAQLWNQDDEVRASLRMEILRYGSLAIEPLIEGLDKLNEYSYEAGKVLVEIGQPAVEPLISALKSPSWLVRDEAAYALGNLGDVRAIPPLVEALIDEKRTIYTSSGQSLQTIGEPAIEPLLKILSDSAHYNNYARMIAAETLHTFKNKRVVEALIKALQDENSEVRGSAVFALGKIADPQSVDALISAINDPDSGVRQRAQKALKKMGFLS